MHGACKHGTILHCTATVTTPFPVCIKINMYIYTNKQVTQLVKFNLFLYGVKGNVFGISLQRAEKSWYPFLTKK